MVIVQLYNVHRAINSYPFVEFISGNFDLDIGTQTALNEEAVTL